MSVRQLGEKSESVGGGETAAFNLLSPRTGSLTFCLINAEVRGERRFSGGHGEARAKKENAAQNPQSWQDVRKWSQPVWFGIIAPSFLVEVRVNDSSPAFSVLLYTDIFGIEE